MKCKNSLSVYLPCKHIHGTIHWIFHLMLLSYHVISNTEQVRIKIGKVIQCIKFVGMKVKSTRGHCFQHQKMSYVDSIIYMSTSEKTKIKIGTIFIFCLSLHNLSLDTFFYCDILNMKLVVAVLHWLYINNSNNLHLMYSKEILLVDLFGNLV